MFEKPELINRLPKTEDNNKKVSILDRRKKGREKAEIEAANRSIILPMPETKKPKKFNFIDERNKRNRESRIKATIMKENLQ